MAKPELSYEPAVPLDVRPLQILEKTTTTPDHLEKATTTVVVFVVSIEMGAQVVDASRQYRDLDRGASTI